MLQFRKIELTDKAWIDRLEHASNFRSADYCFSTLYLWQKTYQPRIFQMNGRILVRSGTGADEVYAFPAGTGPLREAVDAMLADAAEQGVPFRMRGVTPEMQAELEALYPGRFAFSPDEDEYDYIYSAEKLAELPGKKLHAKRNHIRRFMDENLWEFLPMTADNLELCLPVLEQWMDASGASDRELMEEPSAIRLAFDHFAELKLEGGILMAEGAPAAFTVGEKLSRDTYLVHFEKADGRVDGAYSMINCEFAQYILQQHPEIRYINREEDMGLENLRRAKQSYYPDFMVEKSTAVLRDA